jgi:hypothetical protein
MTNLNLLETALLLGVYVTLAGGYGLVYALGLLGDRAMLRHIAFTIYALHALAAVTIVGWTDLAAGWKGLIVASTVAFLATPPMMWRYLQRSHEKEVHQ